MDAINDLPGSTINEKLRARLIGGETAGEPSQLGEALELLRSLPDAEDMEQIIDSTMRRIIDERAASRATGANGFDPASIPGVNVGARNLPPPRRESGRDRVEREERERVARVEALDSVHDPSIDRSAEYVSS